MGACATKPKVLKEGETPEPVKEEVVVATGDGDQVVDKAVAVDEDEKKVVSVEKDIGDVGGDNKMEAEIVDDSNKKRSLSNLFKENEDGKEPTESDKAPAEAEKLKTLESAEKPTEPAAAKEEPSSEKEQSVEKPQEPVKQEVVTEEPVVVPEQETVKSEIPAEPLPVSGIVDAPVKVESEKVTSEVTPGAVAEETKTTETVEEKKAEETK